MADELSKDERRLELLIKARAAGAGIETEAIKSNREIVTSNFEQHAQNWRAAVNAIAKFEAAKAQGQDKALIDASIELSKLQATEPPVNRNLIGRIAEQVNATLRGEKPDSYAYRKMMWHLFAQQSPAADTDPNTLGTVRTMEREFPFEASFITDNDAGVKKNYDRLMETVKIQDVARMRFEAGVEEARDLAGFAQQNPNATPTELQSYIQRLPVLGNPGTMQAIGEHAKKQMSAAPALTGEAKEQYDMNNAARKKAGEMMELPAEETERDRIAKIVASKGFQWWAKRNGFEVGKVVPFEEGKTYADGAVTKGVGVYISGPDDTDALKYASRQSERKQSEDFFWNKRKNRGEDGEKQQTGTIQVKSGTVPSEGFNVNGVYYFTEDAGVRKYLTEADYQAKVAEVDQSIQAAKQTMIDAGETPPPDEQLEARKEELLLSSGLQKSPEPPTQETTQALTGRLLAPRVGDKIGSVRIRVNGEDKYFLPNQMSAEPHVTPEGGGQTQPLDAYVEGAAPVAATDRDDPKRKTLTRKERESVKPPRLEPTEEEDPAAPEAPAPAPAAPRNSRTAMVSAAPAPQAVTPARNPLDQRSKMLEQTATQTQDVQAFGGEKAALPAMKAPSIGTKPDASKGEDFEFKSSADKIVIEPEGGGRTTSVTPTGSTNLEAARRQRAAMVGAR